jgi:hypothetical protein
MTFRVMRLSAELREDLERRLHAIAGEHAARELPRTDAVLLALILLISAAAVLVIR